MLRSPSLVLTVFLVATLASATARGGWGQPPGVPLNVAPSHAPSPPSPASEAGSGAQPSSLLQQSPAARAPRRKGMMIGGLATLGTTYLLTVLVAVNSLGATNGMTSECSNCPAAPRLLVPIAGPWLAMPYAIRDDTTLFAVLGLAQAAGAVLSIVGISRFVADAPTRQVSFGLLPAGDGAYGIASARF